MVSHKRILLVLTVACLAVGACTNQYDPTQRALGGGAIGAGAGALLGGIAGGGRGALAGAVIGGAVGALGGAATTPPPPAGPSWPPPGGSYQGQGGPTPAGPYHY